MTLAEEPGNTSDPDHAEKHFREGTHRTRRPEETLRWLQPHLASFGITRIADITGLDHIGVPVATAYRPNSRSLATTQGKGLSIAAAKASAVMESIELFHAEYIDQPLLLGDARTLGRRHRLVDTDLLPRVRGSRFSPDLEILWMEGLDRMSGEKMWAPFEMVQASARVPSPTGSGCFPSTSNGLSGGNHILEATLHGICEVIERDATTTWELLPVEKKARTRISHTSIHDRHCVELIERCQAVELEVGIWSTTSDVGVAAFLCQVMDKSAAAGRLVDSFTGMGCHPSRNIALLRALTEAVQCRLTLIAGSRDDLFRREYGNARRGEVVPPIYGELQRDHQEAMYFATVPDHECSNFENDLDWILDQLKAVGIRHAIAVDLTKPEYGIPVVRVIVPGLEGPDEDPDYCPGPRARALLKAVVS